MPLNDHEKQTMDAKNTLNYLRHCREHTPFGEIRELSNILKPSNVKNFRWLNQVK